MSVWRWLGRGSRRVAITVAGFAVLVAGIVFLFIPGPGLPLIIAGLAILATEYVWARKALDKAKARARQTAARLRRKRG